MKNDWLKERVGARLRAHRALTQLTLREAAPKIEITFQQLSRLESGKSGPRIETLVSAASVYGCTVTDFFVDVDNLLREEQRTMYHIVDEAAAARANLTELTKALAYLIDLTWSDIRRGGDDRETDVALLKRMQADLKKLRKNTLEGEK